MKLIKLNCPNCNSPLDVPENEKNIKCKYCGTPIAIDDETIKVSHTIYSGDKEERFKNAEALLKLKEYDEAYDHFIELSEDYIYEAKVWYSIVLCLTENFTDFELDDYCDSIVDLSECDKYMDKYVNLETNEELKKQRIKEYEKYKDKLFSVINEANKKAEENLEIDSKTNKSSFIIAIIVFVIVFIIIFVITMINNNENSIKDEVTIETFFNNSMESYDKMTTIKSNDALCHHIAFYSEDKYKEYDLRIEVTKDGSSFDEYTFDEHFSDNKIGLKCYNLEKKKKLETGRYRFYVYSSDDELLDTNSINVE